MEQAVLKKLQEVELEILREVRRVCEKYDLQYYLVGGTLLGAIRHKGFIPWDDDIDISMPRADYNKFLELCKTELDKKYMLHHTMTDDNYGLPSSKIRKNNTILEEETTSDIDTHKGIFIDIFPLDNAKCQYSVFQKIQGTIVKGLYPIIMYRCGANKKHYSLVKRIVANMTKIVSIKLLSNIRDTLMSMNKDNASPYYVCLSGAYNFVKETIPKTKYYPPVKVEFEGEMFNAPQDPDYYLRRLYGDNYMELPPEEERKAAHVVEVSFNTEEVNGE